MRRRERFLWPLAVLLWLLAGLGSGLLGCGKGGGGTGSGPLPGQGPVIDPGPALTEVPIIGPEGGTTETEELTDADEPPLMERPGGPAAKKKKKKKPPAQPPPSQPPPTSVTVPRGPAPFTPVLYMPVADIGAYSLTALGVTDVMVNIGNDLMWGPKTETDLTNTIAAIKTRLEPGIRLHAFYWCFGNRAPGAATVNPWKADAAMWSTFLGRVRLLTSLGCAGQVMDCEDEGRIARRDPNTGAVTVAWWPSTPTVMGTRAREYAAAVGSGQCGIYAIEYMQLNTTGYNGNLSPPTIAAAGWFEFCNALGRPWTAYLGDTYQAADDASIKGTWGRVTTDRPYNIHPTLFSAGTWLQNGAETATGTRIGLVGAAKRTTNRWWAYQDPGYLVKNVTQRTQLGSAIKN